MLHCIWKEGVSQQLLPDGSLMTKPCGRTIQNEQQPPMNVSYHSNHLLSKRLGEGIPNVTGGLLYNNSMTIHRVLVLQYLINQREVKNEVV